MDIFWHLFNGGVGGGVSPATKQTLVKTGAEAAKTEADAGAEEEKDDDSEDDPDPDDGAALAINRENAQAKGSWEPSLLVAVGHILQALALLYTAGAIEPQHKALDLLVGISEGVIDVIFDVTSDPVGCSCWHEDDQNLDQNQSCLVHLI